MKRTLYQTPMHSRLIGLTLAAVLCAGLSQTTYGANLLVNPGFDYTTNGDGYAAPNTTPGTVDPVTSYLYGIGSDPNAEFNGISPSTPNNGTATFLGWTTSGQAAAQTLDSSSFATLPTGAVGYANAGFSLTQTLTGELQALLTYTLNVDIYSRSDYQTFTNYTPVVVQLQNGSSTFLAGTNGPGDVGVVETPFANGKGHVTVTFTTGAGQSVDNLIVNLGSIVGGGAQVSFDNATLTAVSAVPEPGSLVLMACSAVGIFLVARRRNRPQK